MEMLKANQTASTHAITTARVQTSDDESYNVITEKEMKKKTSKGERESKKKEENIQEPSRKLLKKKYAS